MKKLYEIVKERSEKETMLIDLTTVYENGFKKLQNEINELKRLENVSGQGLDVIKVQLAETILNIYGNPYGNADSKFNKPTIAELAVIDIANGCPFMKTMYFGNKKYEGYYQRSNHSYGCGPKHGSIVDEIGLKNTVRNRELTDDEKDACIYYIKNYTLINIDKNT